MVQYTREELIEVLTNVAVPDGCIGNTPMIPIHIDTVKQIVAHLQDKGKPTGALFGINDFVYKNRGSQWRGRVVGFYQTQATRIGYAVESIWETGSVQVWPEVALSPYEPPSGIRAFPRK